MKYALIKDNVVAQVQPDKQEGFILVDDNVYPSMLLEKGKFVMPEPETEPETTTLDKLINSDKQMPRALEEVIKAMSPAERKRLDDHTKKLFNDRQNWRAEL